MILEEEDSKPVTNYNRKNHKNNLKHNKIVIVVYGRKLLLYLSSSDTRLRPFFKIRHERGSYYTPTQITWRQNCTFLIFHSYREC